MEPYQARRFQWFSFLSLRSHSQRLEMKILQIGLAVSLAFGMATILVYITDDSNFYGDYRVSSKDLSALLSLQSGFKKCVVSDLCGLLSSPEGVDSCFNGSFTAPIQGMHTIFVNANGLGLQAMSGTDHCQVSIKFPSNTTSEWKDPKTGELEDLSFDFNLCEAVATWEQVRNSTTILTKEFIDTLPNGWQEYAWRRINKGLLLNRCENKTLCMEKLSLVLPETPPFMPRQFARCAVVGNSGDLLKTKFGDEIDGYDAVVRENGAPIQNYTKYVGRKTTFRLLNRGSAKALDKVVELDELKKDVLIIKTTIHDIMNKMIREVPIRNPVYLMLGASFGSAAKGTGLKALEFALSVCDTVDMYGFTVDPGYKEWTRYFSESRQGHTPLYGRAYYQMMECLGLVKIHSPMRTDFNRVVEWLPSPNTLAAARIVSGKLLRRVGSGTVDPLGTCSIIKKRGKGSERDFSTLRAAAVAHQQHVKGATMYPLEGSPDHGMLCTIPCS